MVFVEVSECVYHAVGIRTVLKPAAFRESIKTFVGIVFPHKVGH